MTSQPSSQRADNKDGLIPATEAPKGAKAAKGQNRVKRITLDNVSQHDVQTAIRVLQLLAEKEREDKKAGRAGGDGTAETKAESKPDGAPSAADDDPGSGLHSLGTLKKIAVKFAASSKDQLAEQRQSNKRKRQESDLEILEDTGIREGRRVKARLSLQHNSVYGLDRPHPQASLPPPDKSSAAHNGAGAGSGSGAGSSAAAAMDTSSDSLAETKESKTATKQPKTRKLQSGAIKCYVCKRSFEEVHHFYDAMCAQCGELNHRKRTQKADMKEMVCLVTGGRVKIGYEMCLMLLRMGARVIVTSRFPKDTALRYSREADFASFKDRLHIYGIDFRLIASVELFCQHIAKTYTRLDVLINNAAQTIRRPPIFYQHLVRNEALPLPPGLPSTLIPTVPALQMTPASAANLLMSSAFTGSLVLGSPKPGTPAALPVSPMTEIKQHTAAAKPQVMWEFPATAAEFAAATAAAAASSSSSQQQGNSPSKSSRSVSVSTTFASGAGAGSAAGSGVGVGVAAPGHSVTAAAAAFIAAGAKSSPSAGENASSLTSASAGTGFEGMDSQLSQSAVLSQLVLLESDKPDYYPAEVFPVGQYDADSQQVDLRGQTTWNTRLEDVSTIELAEVHAVNAMAPFLLIKHLSPLLYKGKSQKQPGFVVNVSSMEGKFMKFKDSMHCHTNMAKASLNMMTRTSAGDYARRFVYMTAVDTGWVTDEVPVPVRGERDKASNLRTPFNPPLDEIDGAMRCLDPIIVALNGGERAFGVFLKDYAPCDW